MAEALVFSGVIAQARIAPQFTVQDDSVRYEASLRLDGCGGSLVFTVPEQADMQQFIPGARFSLYVIPEPEEAA